jgi:hypothetical protein
MKFGISQWCKQAPGIVYKIGDTLYTVASAIGGYGLVQGQPWAMKIGFGCLVAGIALERLSGVKPPENAAQNGQV